MIPKFIKSPPPDESDDPEDEAGAGDGDRHEDGHDDRSRHARLLRVVRLLLCITGIEEDVRVTIRLPLQPSKKTNFVPKI